MGNKKFFRNCGDRDIKLEIDITGYLFAARGNVGKVVNVEKLVTVGKVINIGKLVN